MYKAIMTVVVNGKQLQLYTIGKVAEITGKSVETIRAWERQKVIPTPLFKSKAVRLYHPREAETMQAVLKKLGKGAKKAKIQEEMWTALKPIRKEILDGVKPKEDEAS